MHAMTSRRFRFGLFELDADTLDLRRDGSIVRFLPTYSEDLSIKARQHLESLGVEVYTNARVTRVDSEGIVAGGQFATVTAYVANVAAD